MMSSERQQSEDSETILRFLSDEPWLYDRQALDRRLASFEAELDISIDLLAEWVGDYAPELLPLDHTVATLDRVETFWRRAVTGVDQLPLNLCATRIARVIGEVIKAVLGGQWILCEDSDERSFGLPCVSAMRGLPAGYLSSPMEIVWGASATVPTGHFFRSVNHLIRVADASLKQGSR